MEWTYASIPYSNRCPTEQMLVNIVQPYKHISMMMCTQDDRAASCIDKCIIFVENYEWTEREREFSPLPALQVVGNEITFFTKHVRLVAVLQHLASGWQMRGRHCKFYINLCGNLALTHGRPVTWFWKTPQSHAQHRLCALELRVCSEKIPPICAWFRICRWCFIKR